MTRLVRLGVTAAVVLVTACTPDGPAPVAPTPPPSSAAASPGTVPCEHAIAHLATLSPTATDVLGVAGLPTGRVLQGTRVEDGWFWAKQGLEVRVGAAVEVSVAPEAVEHARIGWGSPAPRGTTARIAGCPQPGCTGDCGWLAFAGGYWVDDPMCVPLIVRAGGREARVSVAVGEGCP